MGARTRLPRARSGGSRVAHVRAHAQCPPFSGVPGAARAHAQTAGPPPPRPPRAPPRPFRPLPAAPRAQSGGLGPRRAPALPCAAAPAAPRPTPHPTPRARGAARAREPAPRNLRPALPEPNLNPGPAPPPERRRAEGAGTRGAPRPRLQPLLSRGALCPAPPHAHAGRCGEMRGDGAAWGGCGGAQRGGRAVRGWLRGAMATARPHARPVVGGGGAPAPRFSACRTPPPTVSRWQRTRSPSGTQNPVLREGGGRPSPGTPGGAEGAGEALGPTANPAGPRAL